MSALIVVAIVLASIAAYVAIGWLIAMRTLPAMWRRALSAWHYRETARSDVEMQVGMMIALWPVMAPVRLVSSAAYDRINAADPMRREELIAEQAKQIAALEREMGIR